MMMNFIKTHANPRQWLVCAFLCLYFLSDPIAVTAAAHHDATDRHSASTNKLWRSDLILDGIERSEWSVDEVELVERISDSLSQFIPTRVPPAKNRNIALGRIGVIVETPEGIKYMVVPMPYVFPSYFYNSLKPDAIVKASSEMAEKATAAELRDNAGNPAYRKLVEIADFLPAFSVAAPHSGSKKAFMDYYGQLREHYDTEFLNKLIPILGESPPDIQPFIHSEQSIILAFTSSHTQRVLREHLQHKYPPQEGIMIHGVVLDILSYYSSCDQCTNTLSKLPAYDVLLSSLREHFSAYQLSEHFGLWATVSSIYPFKKDIEKSQQQEQLDSQLVPVWHLGAIAVNNIHHRIPFKDIT